MTTHELVLRARNNGLPRTSVATIRDFLRSLSESGHVEQVGPDEWTVTDRGRRYFAGFDLADSESSARAGVPADAGRARYMQRQAA